MKQSACLVVNVGSSSIKFGLFNIDEDLKLLSKGAISHIGTKTEFTHDRNKAIRLRHCKTLEQALDYLTDWLKNKEKFWKIICIGHRIVHGGEFTKPLLIQSKLIRQLKKLAHLAPLHQPYNILAVEVFKRLYPKVKQVACFDTAFHTTLSSLHYSYAIPLSYRKQGIRKYGFHGLSYEWLMYVLKEKDPTVYQSKIIAAHLGNGSSLCAINKGKSVDTTMGMTALDGLVMGTRCGSLDPGALLYMLRNSNLTIDALEEVLYSQSGLQGLSGVTNDVRQLLSSNAQKSQFAIDYYTLSVAQGIAKMGVSLQGIDALIFTGGIGENASVIRRKITNRLRGLLHFKPKVLTIKTNEEKMIALHCLQFI